MSPIVSFVIFWAVALFVGGATNRRKTMRGPANASTETAPESEVKVDPLLEQKRFKLEALKAVRESAFARWDKRRNYEWLLSAAIWGAAASFIAVVLGKDFAFRGDYAIEKGVLAVGTGISLVQLYYLLRMFAHTIGDAGIQRRAEIEMFKLADVTDIASDSAGTPLYPKLSSYGWIQIVITLILTLAAAIAVANAPAIPPPQAPPPPSVPTM